MIAVEWASMDRSDQLPANVKIGEGSVFKGPNSFRRFHSEQQVGLIVGRDCTLDGCQFSVGKSGRIAIGDQCYLTNVILMCESEIRVGNRVMIGWNTALADSDFHPIDPALRIKDAMHLSPAQAPATRPPIETKPIVIEDEVWIGPMVTILKGVTIGAGAFIEPGSMITRDVPAATRVGGNPAVVIGKI
jgi:acetyltransferase-like isoleucine patch superfamily enzyme